jgi:hypothetical protein
MQDTMDMQAELPVAAGTLHGLGPHRTHSYVNEEASDEIPFGVLVVKGSADDGAKLPDATDVPVGITVQHHGFAQDSGDLGETGMTPDTMMTVLTHGQCYVEVEDAVVAGGAVRVRSSGAGQKGAFRSAADVLTGAVLTGARWMSSADAGGLAIIEIDMTQATLTEDT